MIATIEPLGPDPRKNKTNALDYQGMEQMNVAREANEIAREDKNIQVELATIGWRTIWSQVALAFVQFCFILIANKHARDAVQAARNSVEVVDRGMKVAERAYLVVEKWQAHGLRGDEIPRVLCVLANTGRTPATLIAYEMRTSIKPELPPAPVYEKHLEMRDMEQIVIAADREQLLDIPMTKNSEVLPAIIEEALKAKRRGTLYVYGCVAYEDVFGICQRVAFFAQYDPVREIFMIVNKCGYNYST